MEDGEETRGCGNPAATLSDVLSQACSSYPSTECSEKSNESESTRAEVEMEPPSPVAKSKSKTTAASQPEIKPGTEKLTSHTPARCVESRQSRDLISQSRSKKFSIESSSECSDENLYAILTYASPSTNGRPKHETSVVHPEVERSQLQPLDKHQREGNSGSAASSTPLHVITALKRESELEQVWQVVSEQKFNARSRNLRINTLQQELQIQQVIVQAKNVELEQLQFDLAKSDVVVAEKGIEIKLLRDRRRFSTELPTASDSTAEKLKSGAFECTDNTAKGVVSENVSYLEAVLDRRQYSKSQCEETVTSLLQELEEKRQVLHCLIFEAEKREKLTDDVCVHEDSTKEGSTKHEFSDHLATKPEPSEASQQATNEQLDEIIAYAGVSPEIPCQPVKIKINLEIKKKKQQLHDEKNRLMQVLKDLEKNRKELHEINQELNHIPNMVFKHSATEKDESSRTVSTRFSSIENVRSLPCSGEQPVTVRQEIEAENRLSDVLQELEETLDKSKVSNQGQPELQVTASIPQGYQLKKLAENGVDKETAVRYVNSNTQTESLSGILERVRGLDQEKAERRSLNDKLRKNKHVVQELQQQIHGLNETRRSEQASLENKLKFQAELFRFAQSEIAAKGQLIAELRQQLQTLTEGRNRDRMYQQQYGKFNETKYRKKSQQLGFEPNANYEVEFNQLSEEIVALRQTLKNLESELKTILTDLNSEIKVATEENQKLCEQLANQRRVSQRDIDSNLVLKSDIGENIKKVGLKVDLERHQQQFNDLAGALNMQDAESQRLSDQLINQRQELQREDESKLGLKNELYDHRQRLFDLEAELERKNAEMEVFHDLLENQRHGLQGEIESKLGLKDDLERHQQQLVDLTEALSMQELKNKKLQFQLANKRQELQNEVESKLGLKNELDEHRQRLLDLEAELKRKNAEIEKFHDLLENQRQVFQDETESKLGLKAHLERHQQQLVDLTGALNMQESKNEKLHFQLANQLECEIRSKLGLKNEMDEQRQRFAGLESEFEMELVEIAKLRDQLESQRRLSQCKFNSKLMMRNELDEQRQRLVGLEAELELKNFDGKKLMEKFEIQRRVSEHEIESNMKLKNWWTESQQQLTDLDVELKIKNAEIEKLIDQLESEHQVLQNEIESKLELKYDLGEHRQRLLGLEAELEMKNSEILKLQDQLENQNRVSHCETAFKLALENEIKCQKIKLNGLNADLEVQKADNEKLRKQMEIQFRDAQCEAESKLALQNELDEQRQRLIGIAAELAKKDADCERLHEHLLPSQQKVLQWEMEFKLGLQNELEHLRLAFFDMESKLRLKTAEVEKVEEQLENLRCDSDGKRGTNEATLDNLQTRERKLLDLEADMGKKNAEIENLLMKLKNQSQESRPVEIETKFVIQREHRPERPSLDDHETELRTNSETERQSVEKVQNELYTKKLRLADLTKELNSMNNEFKKLFSEMQDLMKTWQVDFEYQKSLPKNLKSKNGKLTGQKLQSSLKSSEKDNLLEQPGVLERNLQCELKFQESLQSELEAQKLHSKDLETKLEAKADEVVKVRDELESQREKLTRLESDIKSCKFENEKLLAQLANQARALHDESRARRAQVYTFLSEVINKNTHIHKLHSQLNVKCSETHHPASGRHLSAEAPCPAEFTSDGSQSHSQPPCCSRPCLDAASRVLISRRIIELDEMIRQLENPFSEADVSPLPIVCEHPSGTSSRSHVSCVDSTQSQGSIGTRLRNIDNRISQLIGFRWFDSTDDSVNEGSVPITSTPLPARSPRMHTEQSSCLAENSSKESLIRSCDKSSDPPPN